MNRIHGNCCVDTAVCVSHPWPMELREGDGSWTHLKKRRGHVLQVVPEATKESGANPIT